MDGDKVGSAVTDSDGIGKLNYTFNKAGKPKVESKFAGDDIYGPSNATNHTNVLKIPTITTVETDEGSVTVTLTDENGNLLANKTMKITINGKTYTKTTNSKGQIIIDYPNAWDYKVTAKYAGDNKYLASNDIAPKRMLTITTIVVEGDKITATLTDENGNPLAGKKIVFRVNGIYISVGTTDANGAAIIYFKNADKYKVSANFEGDENYMSSSDTFNPNSDDDANDEVVSNNDVNASGKVAMKETGLPIMAALLVLLASIGLLRYRKRE